MALMVAVKPSNGIKWRHDIYSDVMYSLVCVIQSILTELIETKYIVNILMYCFMRAVYIFFVEFLITFKTTYKVNNRSHLYHGTEAPPTDRMRDSRKYPLRMGHTVNVS